MKALNDIPFVVQVRERRRQMRENAALYARRHTGYIAFISRIAWPWRLLALAVVLGTLTWAEILSGPFVTSIYLVSLFLAFPDQMLTVPSGQFDQVRNMPSMLHREVRGDTPVLRVGMEEAPVSAVKRVIINKRNAEHAYIIFPYTRRINSPILFPVEQLDGVQQWFADNAPELEVVE